MLKEVANRYKVLATLGEGGMGTVYLVEDTTNGQQVALKVLLAEIGKDANQLLQFKQEFRVMAKLKHPNNCEVYDFGLLPDGTPYFTMEVVPGKGLDEMIPVSVDELTSILNQLCQALGFIHQMGFVHCDLKPENIRVKPDGTVKLMDFGLMEVAGQSGGAIKGTLAYIAPEVAKRDRIDQRSDIYSLGAVTCQLLTGETPFKGATPIEVLRAHLNQQPRSPRELNGAIPTLMDTVVLKMMAKEPIARFQSAYDVLSALGIEVDEGMGASLLASAFVGRQSEVAKLQEALQGVKRDRQGSTIWVSGPGGIGKSRLLGEFRFAVQLEEIPFLQGACTEQKAPYGAFVEVLRGLLPVAKEACPEVLAQHAPLLQKLVPEMADGRQAPQMEPEQEKILIQSAISELILKAASKAGAVLVIEDWEKADALSAEALTYMLRNAADHPLLVVVSSREKEGAKGTLLELPALSAPEMQEMVASMLGVSEFPQGLASQLYDLTGGNPQFMGNMLEHLLRTSVLGKSKGKWQLPEAIAPEDLPGDVKELLLERFSTLSEPASRLSHLAAILGQPFGLKIATDLLGLDDNALFDALDELQQAKILVSEDKNYGFATAELKDALYGHLPIEQRMALHTQVAEYFEAQLTAESDVNALTVLAWHFLKSRHVEKAIHVTLKAAQANREMQAMDAALGLLEAGWALVETVDQPAAWQGVRVPYLSQLAAVYVAKANLENATKCLEEGIPLAEQLGDKATLLELLATKVLYSSMAQSTEKLKEGIALYDRIAPLAEEIGNIRTLVRSGLNVGRCLFFSGQNARAQEVFTEAAERAKAADLQYFYARSLCFLGYFRVTGGEETREEGYRTFAEAVEIQQRIGDKFGLGYTLNILGSVQITAGRFKEALDSAIQHGNTMQELGMPDDYAISLLNQVMALLGMGRFAEAAEVGERCLRASEEINSKMGIPVALGLNAIAALYQGDFTKAEADIRLSQEKAKEANNYVYSYVIPNVIEAWLYLGRLQDALGAAQEARDLVSATGNTEIETRLW
ncbi:MAG: protein kinase domain-containing protein, partial [Candidatus Sericytochromatia bacterium]